MSLPHTLLEREQLNVKKAELDNLIAHEIMGWHILKNDPRRLWRAPDRSQVRWMIGEQHFNLCAHPWIDGVNHADDRSFDPIFNYHRSQTDWWQVVVHRLPGEERNFEERMAPASQPASQAFLTRGEQRNAFGRTPS